MKNWFKKIEHPKYDVLVRKDFNEDDRVFEIKVELCDEDSGLSASIGMGFKTKEERDRVFDESTFEKLQEVVSSMIDYVKKW